MSSVKSVAEARVAYRDSPNTFGHESSDVQRFELKRLLGLVASQEFMQDSLKAAFAVEYCEESQGIRHLWERLKVVEDALRDAEEKYDRSILTRICMTLPGDVHCVPSIASVIAAIKKHTEVTQQ